jgi:capsule polysaccharide export protein KpsE/RkpR
MTPSDVVLALCAFLSGIAGVLIGVVATRGKTRAETHHAEAEATSDIVSGYQQLLKALTDQLAAKDAALAQEKRRSALVPILTAHIEALEADLKKTHQSIAALRGNLVKGN